MKLVSKISLIALLVIVIISGGCKKYRFLKFDNIIEVTFTEECVDCAVYIGKHDRGKNDIDIDEFESNFTDYELFVDGLAGPGQYDLVIHWEDYPDINPAGKLRFILVDEGGFPSDPDYSDGGRKMIMQSVVKLKPRGWYFWEYDDVFEHEVVFYRYEKKVPKPGESGNSSENPLSGKWVQIDACSNLAGAKNYFNFSSSSSGEIGQIDCADACAGGGIYTQFNYSISGSEVSITPTSVTDYCGATSTLASPFTVPFSISGNVLTLDGEEFEK